MTNQGTDLRARKEQMEWNSQVFRQGDYNGKGMHHTLL